MCVVGVWGVCVCVPDTRHFSMAPVIYVSVQVSNSLRALLLVWGVAAKGPSYASMHTHISIYIYIYDCMCVSMCVCVCVHLWECQRVLLADFWRILCSCFVSFAFEPLARTSCEPNEERRTDTYTQADLYSVYLYIFMWGPSAMWAVGIGFIVVMFA